MSRFENTDGYNAGTTEGRRKIEKEGGVGRKVERGRMDGREKGRMLLDKRERAKGRG